MLWNIPGDTKTKAPTRGMAQQLHLGVTLPLVAQTPARARFTACPGHAAKREVYSAREGWKQAIGR
jgi:hypothetical protein